jgi:hypothetical protein
MGTGISVSEDQSRWKWFSDDGILFDKRPIERLVLSCLLRLRPRSAIRKNQSIGQPDELAVTGKFGWYWDGREG